jgi:hypothetical protein
MTVKCSVEKELSGLEPRGAWSQDKLTGDKPISESD